MYAEITPADLIDALNPVTQLVEEAQIQVSSEGLSVTVVDRANVGMAHVTVDKEAFETLECDNTMLGVNLARLNQQVKDISNEPVGDEEQLLQVELEPGSRELELSGTAGSMEFTMGLINTDDMREEPDIPNMDLPGMLMLDSDYFSHAIKTASRLNVDTMSLSQKESENTSYMTVNGDTNEWNAVIPEDHPSITQMSANEDIQSTFSLDYLDDMRKGIPSDTLIAIELGEDFPTKMSFEYLDGNVNGEYTVAPRIAND